MLIKPTRNEWIVSLLLGISGTLLLRGLDFTLGHIEQYVVIAVACIVLGILKPRLSCLAYTLPVIYSLNRLSILCGMRMQLLDISYAKMIQLTGVLHVLEGILIILFRHEKSYAVITYKEEKIVGGYKTYHIWFVPLLLFCDNGIYIPFIIFLVYFNQTFVAPPAVKNKWMGIGILIYGSIIVLIGYYTPKNVVQVSLLIMLALHELMFRIDKKVEERAPIYPYPEEGIRVINRSGLSEAKGIEAGDIILAINEVKVHTEEEYRHCILEGADSKMKFKIKKYKGEEISVYYSKSQVLQMRLIFLPEY